SNPWSVVTSVYTRIQNRTSCSSSGGCANGSAASAAAAVPWLHRNGASAKHSAAILNTSIIGELSALRVATIQAGLAAVHHHDGSGAALRAKLRSFGKMRFGERVRLLGSRLELGALFLHQLALVHV